MRFLLLAVVFAVWPLVAVADPSHVHAEPPGEFIPPVPGEGKVTQRVLAPCCWKGTLEGHHSPMVEEVKQEVRRRLLAGEAAEDIEADLIGRYGDEARAVPAGWDLEGAFGWYAGGLLLSGLFMVVIGRRWLSREPGKSPPSFLPSPTATAPGSRTVSTKSSPIRSEFPILAIVGVGGRGVVHAGHVPRRVAERTAEAADPRHGWRHGDGHPGVRPGRGRLPRSCRGPTSRASTSTASGASGSHAFRATATSRRASGPYGAPSKSPNSATSANPARPIIAASSRPE